MTEILAAFSSVGAPESIATIVLGCLLAIGTAIIPLVKNPKYKAWLVKALGIVKEIKDKEEEEQKSKQVDGKEGDKPTKG